MRAGDRHACTCMDYPCALHPVRAASDAALGWTCWRRWNAKGPCGSMLACYTYHLTSPCYTAERQPHLLNPELDSAIFARVCTEASSRASGS
jgi:hypothetical protein